MDFFKTLSTIEIEIDNNLISEFSVTEDTDTDEIIYRVMEDYAVNEKKRIGLVFTYFSRYGELETDSCSLIEWENGYFWKC